jgi:hypothetical protein
MKYIPNVEWWALIYVEFPKCSYPCGDKKEKLNSEK